MGSLSVKGHVSGRVQGVGFRYFVLCHAKAEQISGYARNLNDGRVEFVLQGGPDAVASVIEKMRIGPGHARVTDLCFEETQGSVAFTEFVVR